MTFFGATGPQFRVNASRAGNQYLSSTAALDDGGFVVIWAAYASGNALKGQRYDAAGNPTGSEFLVATLATTNQGYIGATTGLPGGGFLVVWQSGDGGTPTIQAQRFDSANHPVGAAFLVNEQAVQNYSPPAVVALADGHVLISWTSSQPAPGGTLSEVKARLYDAAGTPLGGEFLVNTNVTGSQSNPTLTATASGGFLAAWLSGSGTATLLDGQFFDAVGNKVGGEFVIGGTGAGYPVEASLARLADGRYVAVWGNYSDTGFTETVHGQILDGSGAATGSEFLVTPAGSNPQTGSPVVRALPDGGFVVTWSHPGGTDVSTAVWGRLYDSAGVAGDAFLVNTTPALFESLSSTVVTAGGDIAVAWTSSADSYNYDVDARIFALNKAPVIQSDGGGDTAAFTVAEHQSVVTQVIATDRVGPNPVSYAIVGGADAALFTIDATGHVTFLAAPDTQAPADADGDNVYELVVSASDGELADTQALSVRVAATGRGLLVTSPAQVAVAENSLVAAHLSATDAAATFAITGGADAAKFTIDPATGVLSFLAAPNFEAPGDAGADNVYDVVVTASAAGLSASQALAVAVTNVNEGPAFSGSTALTVAENSASLTLPAAVDADGDPVTYSVWSGTDSGAFYLNSQTRVLTFAANPNFEAPADADRDNVYEIVVRVSDGDLVLYQPFTVTVTNVNEGVTITSNGAGTTAALSLAENQSLVTTVTSRDAIGPVSYSISGGNDASRFTINAQTGVLSFVAPPNFEAPTDFNRDNIYDVTVKASDGTVVDTQALSVSVTNVNEPFSITSFGGGDTAQVAWAENVTGFTVTTDDPDRVNLTMTIVGGEDAGLFHLVTVNGATGYFAFNLPPNYEAPGDTDGDNVYKVVISVTDGLYTDTQAIAFTITNVNEAPFFTSSTSLSTPENTTAVATVTATDPDGPTALTYSISGGLDAAKFAINAATGALSFVSPPDYEARADARGFNVYNVNVKVSDGALSTTQSIYVTVTNVNEAPVIGAPTGSYSFAENRTVLLNFYAADPEGTTPTWSIAGGADAAKFAITAGGTLSFIAGPDFENPTDAGVNNVYDVVIRASDGTLASTQALAITITNLNEAPVIISNGGGATAALTVAENGLAVTTVAATDPENNARTYSIAGGADAAKFAIDPATGALSFLSAPNYEVPTDVGSNNVYDVIVRASDGSLSTTQAIAVTVADVNEAPVITSNGGGAGAAVTIAENSLAVTTITSTDPENTARTYSLAGGADAALFAIDPATGALSFLTAPDFEHPSDAGANNVYDVIVRASDGSLSATQAIAVTVADVNEAPVITSNGGGATAALTVAENGLAVTTVASTDPENTARTYSLAGGADTAKFAIDPATGALSFLTSPDYEAPTDAGANNVYDVIVRASDGTLSTTQAIAVTVADVNEAPVITSNGGAADVSLSLAENSALAVTFAATDPENTPLSWSIVGGADADRFTIDAATGTLSFIAAPDFEAPSDADHDNVYLVTVQASDGSLTASQALAIAVTGLDEAPVISSNGGGAAAAVAVAEGGLAATTVHAADPEGGTILYAIAGGADAALFSIDPATGALSFLAAPDYEAPADAGGDNVYDVIVRAGDGSLWATQAIAVTVTDVNEAPVITSNGGADAASLALSENSSLVATFAATDPENAPRTWSIAGGADAALFTIDPATGALSFVAAPDHEAPADADHDNVYDVVVRVSDGTLSDTQAIAVTVTNVAEDSPPVVYGGAGNFTFAGSSDNDDVTGNGGNDFFDLSQGGADKGSGGAGNDAFAFGAAFGPGDAVDGGEGFDAVGIQGDYTGAGALTVTAGMLTGVEMLSLMPGGRYDVTWQDGNLAAGQKMLVYAGALGAGGTVRFDGSAETHGYFVIYGGAGNDDLIGGAGSDGFYFGPGKFGAGDRVDGGGGAVNQIGLDGSFDFEAGSSLGTLGGNFTNIQTIVLYRGNPGDPSAPYPNVYHIVANDAAVADGHVLTLYATLVLTPLFFDGSAETDGAWRVLSGTGDDTLTGGAGNDLLYGNLGGDTMAGGGGNDTFVYTDVAQSAGGGVDHILDFDAGDRIDLAQIDADTTQAGDQAFLFIGSAAFDGHAGELRAELTGGIWSIEADVDGDGQADMVIHVDTLHGHAIAAGDFIL